MADKIQYHSDKGQQVEQYLRQGESLVSSNEGISLDKFQNMHITQNSPRKNMSKKDDLSVEDKIIRDFKDTGNVVWHTYSKSEPIDEMDLDFKILASIHSLKNANKLCEKITKYDKEWREDATDRMNTFMYIFNQFEENLEEEHDISLPDTVEEIRELRTQLAETKAAHESNHKKQQEHDAQL